MKTIMQCFASRRLSSLFFAAAFALAAIAARAQTADSFNPQANDGVIAMAVQPDGKVLLGGFFSWLNSQPQQGLARVNADGTTDPSFPGVSSLVNAIALQSDGKVVIGGVFGSVGSTTRSSIARLHPNGTVDAGFNPQLDGGVSCLAVQPDGKILLGGWFGTVNGSPRSCIARLNPDGSLDTGFNPGAGYNVTSIAPLPDGKIMVGGWFTTLAGQPCNYLGRLNPNGTLDTSFNASLGGVQFPSANAVLVQADGKVVVGGIFTTVNGQARTNLVRLNADGSLNSPASLGADDEVFGLAQQTDGKVLVAGNFNTLSSSSCHALGRLNTNATLDGTFNAAIVGQQVSAIAMQANGSMVLGGWFTSAGGQPRSCVARLGNTAAATQSLEKQGSAIKWLRSGTGPEVVYTTFDYSGDGVNWTSLGAGTRITGGWQVSASGVPTRHSLRARGFLQGGKYQGSAQIIEFQSGDLAISRQPLSRTNIAGTFALFNVQAGGTSPLTYQWRKGGTNLFNGAKISGATNATLNLNNVFAPDAGAYSVIVRDGSTTITSQVATLTVLDPFIGTQPVGLTNDALTLASFSVVAVGTQPLAYSWLKNGAPFGGGTNVSGLGTSTLTLSNVLGGDAGAYSVVVSNAFGSSTSSVATLTVIDPILTGQPVSQSVSVGQNAMFSVSAIGTTPFSYQWRRNGNPLSGANQATLSLTNLQGTHAGFYDVIVSNASGALTSTTAVLTVLAENTALADDLNRLVNGRYQIYGTINALAIQPNGYVLAGGDFTPDPYPYWYGRFNLLAIGPDGNIVVGAFYCNPNAPVHAIAVQTNGTVFIGGAFSLVSGNPHNRLARLDSIGVIDDTFTNDCDGLVRCLALQADGAVLVGGDFAAVGARPRTRLARLLPDGSVDASFSPVADGSVMSLAVQADGKILVGGNFQNLAGQPCQRLGRLNTNGTFDSSFSCAANSDVAALAVQKDGKILAGGFFTTLGGQARVGFARLNSDGSLDSAFNSQVGNADDAVTSIALDTDGRVVLGGLFTKIASVPLGQGLARLGSDGALDLSFAPGAGRVNALALQKDGRIVVGGSFTTLGGLTRPGLGRLYGAGLGVENVAFDNSIATWLRSGAGPEVWRATFEVSSNASAWGSPVEGVRVAGGWQATGLTIPSNSLVRTRGFVVGGNWFVETIAGLPVPTSQPVSLTNNATTTAVFSITAYGGLPLSYQWLKNGTNLNDGGTVSGARTTTVTLANVLGADAGGYSVVLSNATGSVTSQVASLTVVDPLLTSQPVSAAKNAGESVSFTVTASGSAPLNFQWRQNGTNLTDSGNISGAQTSTLTLTNLVGANAGSYQAVVSNAWGSVTSQVATLSVVDPVITSQPAGQSVNAGQNVNLSVTAVGTAPLLYQWRLNGVARPGATNATLALGSVQGSDAGTYTVVVSNSLNAITSSPAVLAVNLALPDAFNPGSAGTVSKFLIQPDGKALVAGSFGSANNPRYLARFQPDGSLDPSFNNTNVGVDIAVAYALALQTDGRILASGSGRQQISSLVRLNSDGTGDAGFSNLLSVTVNGLVIQLDGSVWAGGAFSYLKPSILTNLALVQATGAVDTNILVSMNGILYTLAQQPDGMLLAGGTFTSVNGQTATRLARLGTNGVLDTNFNASANDTVYCLLAQPDGKVLMGGTFTTLNGTNVNRLGRLNPDGSLDATFNPNINNTVYSLVLDADGRIVVGGLFTAVSGQPRNRLARLNPDGTLDSTFNPNANGAVYALGIQAEGAVLVGGSFSQMTGQNRTNLARLAPIEPAVQVLNYDGTNLTWLRSGSAPEVWRTTFEVSTDGVAWTQLGAGARIMGGWRLAGVSLPVGAYVRARGFTTGGRQNSCSWFVESSLGPALLTSQPFSRTNLAGSTASFWVSANGTPPLSYQWLKGGQPLANAGNISGATTSSLILSNTLGGDAGMFSVIVSNTSGSVTSSVASLTVIEPVIASQPVAVYTNAGQPVLFSVTAIGTAPLTYQWHKNGASLAGANSNTLFIASAQKDDVASYSVVVASSFGVVTSSVAALTLNLALPDAFAPELNDEVRSLATRPDGKILIGGNFNHLGPEWFWEFGQLNADGSRDTNFNGHVNSSTDTIAVQPDGNVLVGGWSTYANDWPHSKICRFYPDGSLDPAINPAISSSPLTPFVDSLVPQPDGKFLVGGSFTSLAGQARNYLARFNANGTLDSFNPGASTYVMVLALQPDGMIIAGGNFTTLGGQTRNRIGRLYADGTLDTNFNPNANATVNALVVQPDGKILVGGGFTSIAGVARSYLARLLPDGTLDASFNASLNGGVSGIALQADGSVLIAGGFTTAGGQSRTGLARVSATGVVDPYWSPQVGGGVGGLAIQPDGKVLLAGSISSLNGLPRWRLARLDNPTPAAHQLDCDAAGITWWRSGASPEISLPWFELSADGTNWTHLGPATRVPGGWRMNTTLIALNSYIRARGFASGGRWNGSLSLIEDQIQVPASARPVVVSGDVAFGVQSNRFGFTVRALSGQAIVVEATTDFHTWVPLQTNFVTSAAEFVFRDSQLGVHAHRFYRARAFTGSLPPPSIRTSLGVPGNDGFGLDCSAIAGQTIVIDASSNLVDWLPLQTNEMGVEPLYFRDSSATNYPVRFYRLRVP